MGITIGTGRGSMADPNIVPLIDILLVLIIIFMVITPTAPKGLPALVPQPDEKPRVTAPPLQPVVIVQVFARGGLKINEEPHTWDTLGPRLDEIFKKRAEKVAFVQGDETVLFQEVARAMDTMRSSGIDRIGLITANMGPRQ